VRVQVDPVALAGRGLGLEDVRSVLALANVNQPKGNLDGPRQNYLVSANDQLPSADGYKSLIIAYQNGAAVRLTDIAKVLDGVENAQLAGWAAINSGTPEGFPNPPATSADGQVRPSSGVYPAVILNVQRQPGANLIEVAERVKKLLPRLEASLPQGIRVDVLSDRTETVRASVRDVEFTLVLTMILVVAVIYLFLRTLRATIIPGVAVPLSLIATFGVMLLLGYSLNNLTLMALTISTGFVVDDAIVMIENIARHIEEGDPPFLAALKGSKQIGFTIVSLTVSLVAVLIPLLFMGGIIGRLFREFAVTLSTAIVASAIISLTLTAMMCGHVLRPLRKEDEGRIARASEAAFDWMVKIYDRGLGWVLNHQALTLFATIATVALTFFLAVVIPKGLFPQQDTGMLLGITEAPIDVSFPSMIDRQQSAVDIIRVDPDVDNVASFIGADGTNPTLSTGRLSIALKSRSQRKADAQEIIDRLNAKLAQLTGVTVYLQAVQDLQLSSQVSRTQYQYTIEDADPKELSTWAPQILDRLKKLPQLADVASDQQEGALQMTLVIDRDSASRMGITAQAIDDTLYDAFGQRPVSTIFTQLNLYRVILEVTPEYQANPNGLGQIYMRATTGQTVPLSSFAHFEQTQTAVSIAHEGQFPAVTLSFNLAPGAALGDAVRAINDAVAAMGAPLGLHADFQGAAAAFGDSLSTEPILILAAIVTVYIVLGVLYESYIHPITILSTLPSAGVGAFLALLLSRSEFSIIALIGIVLLIGIVKKNAIMMIDFALEAEREQGKSPREAIHQACLLRFRPIMMTTLAALLGGVPLALGTGIGAELRRPLGITIVGGLLLSQVLTLYTTPVIYLYMERLAARFRGRRPGASSAPLPAPETP
jgi:multidrug efflux pump